MADQITNRPIELEQALADAMHRTQRQPELALSHAVELDRQLGRMGFSEPTTYARHGTATPRCNTDAEGAPWRTSTPGQFDCLNKALRQSVQSPGLALATAFNNARGPEIPALNLLYANECLDIDSLWLRFFNKYLAYHGAQNAIALNPGSASRFERLCSPAGRHLSIQTTGPLVSVIMPLFGAVQLFDQVVSIKNVVTQHECAGLSAHKVAPDDECLCKAVGAGLHSVLNIHAPLAAAAQQLGKARSVLWCADQQHIADRETADAMKLGFSKSGLPYRRRAPCMS